MMQTFLLALLVTTQSLTFEATYTAVITDVPAGAKVWVPIPRSTAAQQVGDLNVISAHAWQRESDPEFGNEYLVTIADGRPINVEVVFNVTRNAVDLGRWRTSEPSREELARALRADKYVTLSPRIKTLAAELTRGKTTTMEKASAIYEHVLSTMRYDKTVPGWGMGDTERACDVRAGNCTDFHSLFLSLARASGIPSRFVMGFPLPKDKNRMTGYHCWAEFYVEGRGWIPVDISEASKLDDPARRAWFFGNLDPERVEFTLGRDLRLGTAEPLNYFIYPHAEAEGKVVGCPIVTVEYRTRS